MNGVHCQQEMLSDGQQEMLSSNPVKVVKNVCSICGQKHYTRDCLELSRFSEHVPDKPFQNLSRYSVPNGLLIIDSDDGNSFVITTQKFAKGTRFGPVLAPKTYSPVDSPFPLIIFLDEYEDFGFMEDLSDDIKQLFSVRNFYLDTADETKSNWMIHVDIAKYSNEQNLMCYQDNDQIYYTSTRDIELGDILKVWYSPNYAKRMGTGLLTTSNYNVCNNILRQVSLDYGFKIDGDQPMDTHLEVAYEASGPPVVSSEISLPSINSLMKSQSSSYNNIYDFDNLSPMVTTSSYSSVTTPSTSSLVGFNDFSLQDEATYMDLADDQKHHFSSPDSGSQSMRIGNSDVDNSHKYSCELCNRKYITKSNLEKHMRSHALFMCVVCMKMFPSADELKEHDCFKLKASSKKSLLHCSICLKVLSNAWSLQRHMKIHRSVLNNIDKQEDMEAKIDEVLNMNQPSQMLPIEIKMEIKEEPDFTMDDLIAFESPISETPESYLDAHCYDNPSPTPSSSNFEKCIVCARIFKNPNSLEKHLRNVHTAHIIRPELTTSIKKTSEYRRIVLNNTKPIKADVAKALASKLNKKHLGKCKDQAMLLAEQNIVINNVEYNLDTMTPVIEEKSDSNNNVNENRIIIISNVDILAAGVANGSSNIPGIDPSHMFNSPGSLEKYNQNTVPKLVPITNRAYNHNNGVELSNGTENEVTDEEHEKSPKVFIIDKSGGESDVTIGGVSNDQPIIIEQHKCGECDKIFAKKYQLKRHLEIHENLFYFCPFCARAPVKARSSLQKHFVKDHNEQRDVWHTSNFMSKLLKKYEKPEKVTETPKPHNPKPPKPPKVPHELKKPKNEGVKKTPKLKKPKKKIADDMECPVKVHKLMINDDDGKYLDQKQNLVKNEMVMLPQGPIPLEDMDDHQNQQQISFHNLLLDPITLDEENNLIKYNLNNDQEIESQVAVNPIDSFILNENFKNSFNEIQEKLDAELDFNEQMINWNNNLNDDSSEASSTSSLSSRDCR